MCVFRHLLQILVTSNSQKKKSQQPSQCGSPYPIGSSLQGWILSNVYKSRPQHQPISWICSRWFLFQKKIQKSSPNGFWMVILHHCYEVMEKNHPTKKKTIKKHPSFFVQLPLAPSHHPIHPSILLPGPGPTCQIHHSYTSLLPLPSQDRQHRGAVSIRPRCGRCGPGHW